MIKYCTKKEYQYIADIYELGKIKQITHLKKGYGGSAKVMVETSIGKFVISKNLISTGKGIVGKTKQSLQYEIDMLNILKGMCVPFYIQSKNKRYIEKIYNTFISVYNYLPGKSPEKITPTMAYQLGLFFGEFHQRSHKFRKNLSSRRQFYDLNPSIMKKMRPFAYKQNNPTLKKVVHTIEQGVIDNYPHSNLPKGPIHVDPTPKNILFQKNKLSGVVDFGNFYIGPLMIDVGKAIMWNCCSDKKLNTNLLKKFIDGYNHKRKLNKVEIKYLKKSILFAIYSHIWVDLYHVPKKFVPLSYALFLVRNFLPIAKHIEGLEELW